MNTHQLLDNHPSVQALNITTGKVNPAKAQMHARVINARGFTTTSAVEAAHKGAAKDCKGQKVVVVRHEENITAALQAKMEAAARAKKAASQPKAAQMPPEVVAAASQPELPPIGKPPKHGGAQRAPAPAGSRSKKPGLSRASLVSSVESFDATSSRADSYTEYTCSCCHPRAASSVGPVSSSACTSQGRRSTAPSSVMTTGSVPLSAYENMSSISERIAKQRSKKAVPSQSGIATTLTVETRRTGDSMTSSKLRVLENELSAEREQRKRTEHELEEIKLRQQQLLSRLSANDQAKVAEIVKTM